MGKQLNFPPDVEIFVHELCVKAILRAIQNGTYVYPENAATEEEREKTIEEAK